MRYLAKSFALCVDNTDYKASLISGKVYRIIPDSQATKDDLVRIVDDSGEDYLYHKAHFVFVDFLRAIAKRIRSLEATTA
jgi:acyl CoA:acetate/3-ketoacid CoA transferase